MLIANVQESSMLKNKKTLFLKENKAYTTDASRGKNLSLKDCEQSVNILLTQNRVEKNRVDTDTEQGSANEIPLIIEMFTKINPACKNFYGNKTQRKACQDLIDSYTFDEVKNCIENVLPQTNGREYFPTITTPVQLRDKWVSLKSAVYKQKSRSNKVDIIT